MKIKLKERDFYNVIVKYRYMLYIYLGLSSILLSVVLFMNYDIDSFKFVSFNSLFFYCYYQLYFFKTKYPNKKLNIKDLNYVMLNDFRNGLVIPILLLQAVLSIVFNSMIVVFIFTNILLILLELGTFSKKKNLKKNKNEDYEILKEDNVKELNKSLKTLKSEILNNENEMKEVVKLSIYADNYREKHCIIFN